MAQPPQSMLPASQPLFSGIDAAVASVIENNPSCNTDIIGTAVALSTVTMDRIETMMQNLRGRGKRIAKSHHPLTVDRPSARAQSPSPKTALGYSPPPKTGRGLSPQRSERSLRTGRSPGPKTARGADASQKSLRTGRGISPVPHSTRTGREVSPRPSKTSQRREPDVRTGRGISPAPKTAIGQSTGPKTGRGHSPQPSERSLRTGRGVSPGPNERSLRTGRGISPVPRSSTRTGREVSPGPRSSGYPTALEPASPLPPASRRQSISNVLLPSTRTGREVSPPPRSSGYPTALEAPQKDFFRPVVPNDLVDGSNRTAREASPQPKTGISPVYPTARSISPEPRTAFSASPVSSKSKPNEAQRPLTPAEQWKNVTPGPGPKICPARSPVLNTAREGKQQPSSRKSNREIQNEPKANEIWKDLVKAAEKQQVPAGVRSPGLQKDASQRSLRTAREVSPGPRSSGYPTAREVSPGPRSSGYPTAVEPASPLPPASRRQSISNVLLPSTRTGREVSPTPRSSGYPTGRGHSPQRSERSLRTARELSSGPKTARSADASEKSTRTGRGVSPQPPPYEQAIRTGRDVSPGPRSSGYPTAIEPATPPSPASRRQSISNVLLPSTRTGREVSPPPRSSGYPTARSPGPKTDQSLRSGREITPRSSGYPTAISPASALSPASRRQSISNIPIPSTRTGLESSPRPSEIYQQHEADLRTGVALSPVPRSSGYPTALEPATPPSPASRRQSISNVHLPSTRTGREASPPQNNSFRPSSANDVLDGSTRTARENSPSRSAMNPQLITRTTVVPVNQNGEDGPPGVMLFVHSFYVFSMTLNAWANYLSNQNAPPSAQ